MTKLLFATNNPHKLGEIRSMLGSRFTVLSLQDIGFSGEIPEDRPTLEENASKKAFFLFRRCGCDCFADDTGLEVEALDGEPGVFSARYAGEGKNADDNTAKLLQKMAEIKNRHARFRTVISLIFDGEEFQFEGVVNGEIIDEKRGTGGFGYDPVFMPEGSELTFAEMQPAEKNKISHRGRALGKMVEFLLRRP